MIPHCSRTPRSSSTSSFHVKDSTERRNVRTQYIAAEKWGLLDPGEADERRWKWAKADSVMMATLLLMAIDPLPNGYGVFHVHESTIINEHNQFESAEGACGPEVYVFPPYE